MGHTPQATAALARVAELRALAAEYDKGYADRRSGLGGYTNADSTGDHLREQARAIEAGVLVPFRILPVFDFTTRQCSERYHAFAWEQQKERARVSNPRMHKALLDIEAMGKPGYRVSLFGPRRWNLVNA